MTCENQSVNTLRKIIIDSLVLVILTGFILIINHGEQWFHRGFFCGDESLMYPYRSDTITAQVLHWVGTLVPIITILIIEWFYLRKEEDEVYFNGVRIPAWTRSFFCTAVSFGIGLCIVEITTNIAKDTIGRPRPHFFDVCQPSINCSSPEWQGRYIQAEDYHCTGSRTDLIPDMRKSFLSGHSSWAAFTMIFTALYLERRKFACMHSARHLLQFLFLMMSWFTALSRISDFKHHWSDVLAGYCLGTVAAFIVIGWCVEFVEKKKQTTLSEVTAK